jgi:hypothetical protein
MEQWCVYWRGKTEENGKGAFARAKLFTTTVTRNERRLNPVFRRKKSAD